MVDVGVQLVYGSLSLSTLPLPAGEFHPRLEMLADGDVGASQSARKRSARQTFARNALPGLIGRAGRGGWRAA